MIGSGEFSAPFLLEIIEKGFSFLQIYVILSVYVYYSKDDETLMRGDRMEMLKKVTIVLPSLDPDEKLKAVIDGLLEVGFSDIILVNDGSKPENLHWFEEMNAHEEVTLLHHQVNRGKGAALKTAFTWFLENRPEQIGVVTVDGDNQHHPEDTKACALNMGQKHVMTLGVRDFDQPDVPARSKSGNKITSKVFKIFCGMTLTDTQTGLRAIPRDAVEEFVTVKGDRFEYETNMLLALKEKDIPYEEVKIRTVYIEENKSSHFHPILDSWRIYKLILAHFFKYTLSAMLAGVLELVLVWLLNLLLHNVVAVGIQNVLVTASARLLSSVPNFYLNKKMVFKSKVGTEAAAARYLILMGICLVLQMALNELIYFVFSIGAGEEFLRTAVHLGVMIVLFVANFVIQQRWVFAESKKRK